jgi:hypothetical protein
MGWVLGLDSYGIGLRRVSGPIGNNQRRNPMAFAEGCDAEQVTEGVVGHGPCLRSFNSGVKSRLQTAMAWAKVLLFTKIRLRPL